MKKRVPIIILRLITVAFAVAGLLFSIFLLPSFGRGLVDEVPVYSYIRYPVIVGLYGAVASFLVALFEMWRLLDAIDRDGHLATKNLRAIKRCAIIFSILYFICAMPVVFLNAEIGDAPGLVLIGALLDGIPIGAAAVAAILERVAERSEG
ncbi:MAG: DUF2975 domain-containing protein [Lachnospiraceae bacterium]|jgi:hypothetical protein|nr:DUF2975 domain-containing protein [Lachnospiraceae bacterium]